MKRYLIIAEKKSIREPIQEACDKHKGLLDFVADVTYMANPVAHISDKVFSIDPTAGVWEKLELKTTEVPEGYYVANTKFTPVQVNEITSLIQANDYDLIINACDNGLYGQFAYLYTKEKVGFSIPDKRMWHMDLTENGIIRALQQLEDNEYILSELLKRREETGRVY
jgi:hypothetical protein